MPTVLITGVCGFVGSRLAEYLKSRVDGLKLVGLDNLLRAGSETNPTRLRALVEFRHGDVRCASDFETLPPADWVIDAAANPSVLAGVDGKSSSRQLLEHNLVGTINLLEYCRRHQAGLILLSTSRVYSIPSLAGLPLRAEATRFVPDAPLPGGVSAAGVDETFSTAAPVSLYGASKLASEQLSLEYGAAFDFPVWVNRCGVLAGAGQFGTAAQGIFSYWVHAWRARRPLRYLGFGGAGKQVRDALHPDDLAALVLRQMEETAEGWPTIVNVAGGVPNTMSLQELSGWCADRFGPREVTAVPENRAYDLPWVVLDSRLAAETWGWRPARNLESILEEIAGHAETNPGWLDVSLR